MRAAISRRFSMSWSGRSAVVCSQWPEWHHDASRAAVSSSDSRNSGLTLRTMPSRAGRTGNCRAIDSVSQRRMLPSSVAASSSRLWPVATTSNPPSTAARLNT